MVFFLSLRAGFACTFQKGSIVTFDKGTAPNGHLSLAWGKKDQNGFNDTHLYLMSEPNHKVLQTLHDGADMGGPREVFWSPDSRAVVVVYRTDLNHWGISVYRIKRERLAAVHGFDILAAAAKKAGLSARTMRENERACHFTVTWLSGSRFVVRQEEIFYSPSARPAERLGKYAEFYRLPDADSTADKRYLITVSVEAICQVRGTGNTVQMVSTKPGPFHH